MTERKRKPLPSVGVADFNPSGWRFPLEVRNEILAAVNLTEADGAEFVATLEYYVLMSKGHQELKVSRSLAKAKLSRAISAGHDFLTALVEIPLAVQGYFRSTGGAFTVACQLLQNIVMSLERAAMMFDREHAGAGSDCKEAPAILAAGIARELVKLGIRPSFSRPKEAKKQRPTTNAYWKVATICFQHAGFVCEDLYHHLKKGLSINITSD